MSNLQPNSPLIPVLSAIIGLFGGLGGVFLGAWQREADLTLGPTVESPRDGDRCFERADAQTPGSDGHRSGLRTTPHRNAPARGPAATERSFPRSPRQSHCARDCKPLFGPTARFSNELTQLGVRSLCGCEERDTVSLLEAKLAADDQWDPGRLRGFVGAHDARQRAFVGHGQGRVAELLGAFEQLARV